MGKGTNTKLVRMLCVFGIFFFISPLHYVSAAISDRVAAFVDDHAITMSELKEQYEKTIKMTPEVTELDVANTMINRVLLLREAKKYKIEAADEDEIIKEYIDLKVRAFITVGEGETEAFYKQNLSRFSGKDYENVRSEIERYLTEKELNEKLKNLISELRKNAYIRIQLDRR